MTTSKRMAELFNKSPVKPAKRRALAERLQDHVLPLEKQKQAVTPQEWKFIQSLVDGEGRQTLKEAAVNAGFPADKANKIAHELTDPRRNPHIVAAIQRYRQDIAEKYGTSIERHLRDLQIIRDKAMEAGNFGAAVQAEYRRGQALGTIYVERKEIRHGTIDSMSADEVRRKLEEIKALYGGPPPQGILEVLPEAQDAPQDEAPDQEELPEEEQPTLLEVLANAQRSQHVQKPTRTDVRRQRAAAREQSRAGNAGLHPRATDAAVGDTGAQGGGEGQEDPPESASGGVPCDPSPAPVLDSGAVLATGGDAIAGQHPPALPQ